VTKVVVVKPAHQAAAGQQQEQDQQGLGHPVRAEPDDHRLEAECQAQGERDPPRHPHVVEQSDQRPRRGRHRHRRQDIREEPLLDQWRPQGLERQERQHQQRGQWGPHEPEVRQLGFPAEQNVLRVGDPGQRIFHDAVMEEHQPGRHRQIHQQQTGEQQRLRADPGDPPACRGSCCAPRDGCLGDIDGE
jgi:hypothetical protein